MANSFHHFQRIKCYIFRALVRMTAIDPMAIKYSSLTPYNYSFNDPIAFNDPLGDDPNTGLYGSRSSTPRDGGVSDFVWDASEQYGFYKYYGQYSSGRDLSRVTGRSSLPFGGWNAGMGRSDWSGSTGSDSYRSEVAAAYANGGYEYGGNAYTKNGGLITTVNGHSGVWIDYYTNGDKNRYIDSEFRVFGDAGFNRLIQEGGKPIPSTVDLNNEGWFNQLREHYNYLKGRENSLYLDEIIYRQSWNERTEAPWWQFGFGSFASSNTLKYKYGDGHFTITIQAAYNNWIHKNNLINAVGYDGLDIYFYHSAPIFKGNESVDQPRIIISFSDYETLELWKNKGLKKMKNE